MTQNSEAGLPADTWDRAYADILFRHIDRFNDVCDEDPLERIAKSLRDAFDQVTVVDPIMNRNEAWRAAKAGEPWPVIGTSVWYPEGALHRRPMKEAKVMLTFRGEDDRVWCLLQEGKNYSARPALGLSDTPEGPLYLEKALKQPETARKFLQGAGILDENGELSPWFRESPNDSAS